MSEMNEHGLTRCELQQLRHLADGKTSKASARELGIADATVKVHRKSLYRAIKATGASHAVAIGFRTGLLS